MSDTAVGEGPEYAAASLFLARNRTAGRKYLGARAGCLYFPALFPHLDESSEEYGKRIRDFRDDFLQALKGDHRVVSARMPDLSRGFYDAYGLGPFEPDLEPSETLEQAQLQAWYTVYRSSFVIEIAVPIEEQPTFGLRPPPSAVYTVAWNGTQFIYVWSSVRPIAKFEFGGEFVRDVILDALGSAGVPGYLQGPSPAHSDIEVICDVDEEEVRWESDDSGSRWTIWLPEVLADSVVADYLVQLLRDYMEPFYRLENLSTRVSEVVAVLEDDIEGLTRLEFDRAESRATSIVHRINDGERNRKVLLDARALVVRLTTRSYRRQERFYIARVLYGCIVLRSLQQSMHQNIRTLEAPPLLPTPPVLARDLQALQHQVESTDAEYFERFALNISQSLDNRQVVIATIAGGLSGAAAGGMAALFQ